MAGGEKRNKEKREILRSRKVIPLPRRYPLLEKIMKRPQPGDPDYFGTYTPQTPYPAEDGAKE